MNLDSVALICLPLVFTRHKITRWEGALFLFFYKAYILYLILDAKEHDPLPRYSETVLWFVLPITAVDLSVVATNQFRRMRGLMRKRDA